MIIGDEKIAELKSKFSLESNHITSPTLDRSETIKLLDNLLSSMKSLEKLHIQKLTDSYSVQKESS